jgi:hypothetical protein
MGHLLLRVEDLRHLLDEPWSHKASACSRSVAHSALKLSALTPSSQIAICIRGTCDIPTHFRPSLSAAAESAVVMSNSSTSLRHLRKRSSIHPQRAPSRYLWLVCRLSSAFGISLPVCQTPIMPVCAYPAPLIKSTHLSNNLSYVRHPCRGRESRRGSCLLRGSKCLARLRRAGD